MHAAECDSVQVSVGAMPVADVMQQNALLCRSGNDPIAIPVYECGATERQGARC